MPDLERLTDELRSHMASTPEQRGWAAGYKAGKTKARIEVLAIIIAVYFIVALIGHFAST
jgi:hypothetical protein